MRSLHRGLIRRIHNFLAQPRHHHINPIPGDYPILKMGPDLFHNGAVPHQGLYFASPRRHLLQERYIQIPMKE